MDKKKVHLIGIGGIGMSALARYFLAQKWSVSGSDMAFSPLIADLQKEGINIKIEHKKANITPDLDLVVHSQAISPENPEYKEAKRLKIPLKRYSEALGQFTYDHKTVSIAGSHGKSTTTALTALIFMEAKLDPTVIIGTKLKDLRNKNFRIGRSEYLIIEADEYKESFLDYKSDVILITNIDREHLDHYKNFGNVKKGFLNFVDNLKPDGILILNKDDEPLYSLKDKFKGKKVVWYSLKDKNDEKYVKQIKKVIKIFGTHNLSNALGAFKLTKALDINNKDIIKAISGYTGAWRRMEFKGELEIPGSGFKTQVYDDYAHHPTEASATLQAFREKFPDSLLICVFQPHQNQRLKALFKEFSKAFDTADVLILLDVYTVAGRDKVSHNINSKKLVEVINKDTPKALYLPLPEKLPEIIKEMVGNNKDKQSVVVMMGAGDIVNLTPKLLE